MFKKKISNTPLDRQTKDIMEKLGEARSHLISATEKVISRNGVISLYSDGPDKEMAIKDLESSKSQLLASICHYDYLMTEYNDILKKEGNRETTTGWWNTFSDSHAIIENVWRNFYKK